MNLTLFLKSLLPIEDSNILIVMSYCVILHENKSILYLGSEYSLPNSTDSDSENPALISYSSNVMFFPRISAPAKTPTSLVIKQQVEDNINKIELLTTEVKHWNIMFPDNPAHFEYFESSKSANIIMPKIEGKDLDKFYCSGNIKLEILILQATAMKLDELHKKGLCHGDIHPGNIIVNQSAGKITVSFIDFGRSSEADKESIIQDVFALCVIARDLLSDINNDVYKIVDEATKTQRGQHSLAKIIETIDSTLEDLDQSDNEVPRQISPQ